MVAGFSLHAGVAAKAVEHNKLVIPRKVVVVGSRIFSGTRERGNISGTHFGPVVVSQVVSQDQN